MTADPLAQVFENAVLDCSRPRPDVVPGLRGTQARELSVRRLLCTTAWKENGGMRDFPFKPEDRPDDEAPVSVAVETIQPRRVRTQLAKHAAGLLGFQDDFEGLLTHISSSDGRDLWRQLHKDLSATHRAVKQIIESVERGG